MSKWLKISNIIVFKFHNQEFQIIHIPDSSMATTHNWPRLSKWIIFYSLWKTGFTTSTFVDVFTLCILMMIINEMKVCLEVCCGFFYVIPKWFFFQKQPSGIIQTLKNNTCYETQYICYVCASACRESRWRLYSGGGGGGWGEVIWT